MRRADSLSPDSARERNGLALPSDDGLCVCLHALSSFQRTDRLRARGAQPHQQRFGCLADRVQGNLLRLLEPSDPVNPQNAIRKTDEASRVRPSLGVFFARIPTAEVRAGRTFSEYRVRARVRQAASRRHRPQPGHSRVAAWPRPSSVRAETRGAARLRRPSRHASAADRRCRGTP